MEGIGRARRVRIYLSQGDRTGGKPAHVGILQLLRAENAQGATVFVGVEGFGAAGEIHGDHLADTGGLPLVVEWIDRAEVVERLLERVEALVPRGLITVEDTEIVLYQPQRVRSVPKALCAADVMSRKVSAVERSRPLRDLVELMLGQSYRAVPVVEAGKPIGIITNTDLVRRGGLDARLELFASLGESELRAALERLQSAGKVAGDVMTPRPTTVEASTPLRSVAALMAQRRLKRLPVVDEQGALVGVVSRVDLLRTAAGGGAAAEPLARDLGLDATGPVSRIMRADAPVVHPDTPLPVVLQAVMATRLNRALVVDAEGRVVGLVTDAELLDRLTPALRPGALRSLMHRLPFAHPSAEEREAAQHARARTAKDLMVRDVAAVTEDTPMSVAIEVMLRGSQKVLAVIDTEGRLQGIVDRADLLHGLVSGRGGE